VRDEVTASRVDAAAAPNDSPVMSADLLLSGGRIFRGLAQGFTDALAVTGGRVAALGADALGP